MRSDLDTYVKIKDKYKVEKVNQATGACPVTEMSTTQTKRTETPKSLAKHQCDLVSTNIASTLEAYLLIPLLSLHRMGNVYLP